MDKAIRKARFKTAIRGLATVTGLRARGFFVPYKHAARTPKTPRVFWAVSAVTAVEA